MGTSFTRLPVHIAKGLYVVLAKPVFARFHLHSYIRQAYHWILRASSDDQVTIAVDGTGATFRTRSVDEIRFFADTPLGTAGVHEAIESEGTILTEFLEELNDDDIVLDIGAHFGFYTCLAQNRLSDGGRVIAFEPYPPNYDSLTANIALNSGPAEAHQVALSDEDGDVSFFEFGNGHAPTENALLPHFDGATETTVEARMGDSFLADRGRIPDVIKIDVEGAELKVLTGLQRTLQNPECRCVYCEVHPFSFARHGGSHEAVEQLLADNGYETTIRDRKGELTYWIRAVRP